MKMRFVPEQLRGGSWAVFDSAKDRWSCRKCDCSSHPLGQKLLEFKSKELVEVHIHKNAPKMERE